MRRSETTDTGNRRFGERLRGRRLQQAWTQKDLAKKLGVTREAISHWEAGRVMPEAARLKRVGRILKVSVDELFGK